MEDIRTMEDIRDACRHLALSGLPLCVHASLRSFGWVEGGAGAVVRGLLEEGCTLMVPTFSSEAFAVAPPDEYPAQNGVDDALAQQSSSTGIYSPSSADIDGYMGALPAAVVLMPKRVRGDHPLDSFSAVGPLANALISGQRSTDVYAPLRRLAELNGRVLLMGVGLESMTLLHLAEQQAGRSLFLRWALDPQGQVASVEVGGCSEGFDKLAPVLAALETQYKVGESLWKVYPARETLELAAAAIRAEPAITHCDDPGCERCNDMVRGGPVYGSSFFEMMGRTWA